MRVAVFDAVGTYFSAPTLRCLLEEFDANKVEVDVFLRRGGGRLGEISRATARRFPVPFRIWTGDWANTLRQWQWYFKYRGYAGHRALAANHYDLAVGLDPEGVIAAHRHWRRTGTPFVYLSFEMIFRDELRQKGMMRLKGEEVAASREAAFVIVPDKWRAQRLADENRLPLEKMEFLPVAPRGGTLPARSDYLREKLGIAGDETVVLHAGTFHSFAGATEITETLPQWPHGYILVVNTRDPLREGDPFIARLREVGGNRIRLTSGGKSATEYDELVRSADIGLALYRAESVHEGRQGHPFWGKNIETIGLSSGKLATYVKNGLPVVCGGVPELRPMMGDYRFGEYLERFEDLPQALLRVKANLNACSVGARRFFAEQLDFDLHWPRIWRRMQGAIHDR